MGAFVGCTEEPPKFSQQICKENFANIMVKSEPLYVRTACQPYELVQGLKSVKKIDDDVGLLFVFGYEQKLALDMKDTYVPLDVAFLNENLEIVDIKPMQPLDETPVKSDKPASYALEVKQGFFSKKNIQVGDTITLVTQ